MGSYDYKTPVHLLGGKNADGGYGGPLCKDPFGKICQDICDKILVRSDAGSEGPGAADALCYNNFKDPTPELTKEQVASIKGYDYGDKTICLPFPLPWPAGTPHAGFVPQSNPLTGRWITCSGGDAAFIKESIAQGLLGAAEAAKIEADTDVKKTGGMFLRITQDHEEATVDASVAKFARGLRHWKSGHYFYEPLVSGGNLFGVWVLPEEYRKIGFFWEMDSGKCFRIQRNAWNEGGFLWMRQSTEAFGRCSHVMYVKVSDDPETPVVPPLQSRDYSALGGIYNAPDNLGNPFPCEPIDLDAPLKRDAWLDTNGAAVAQQQAEISKAVVGLEVAVLGFGWKSEAFDVSVDAVWEALENQARNPQKYMDVTDVKVKDEAGFLSRTMVLKANKKQLNEHIILNRVASEMVFRLLDKSGKPQHEERVIAVVDEPNLHLEYYQRDCADAMRVHSPAAVNEIAGSIADILALATTLDNSVEPVVGLGYHSDAIEGVRHDVLWKALVDSVRHPLCLMTVPLCSAADKSGYVERTLTLSQRVYVREECGEIAFRTVTDGKEGNTERVIILRGHPDQIEICDRIIASGFRAHSPMLKVMAATQVAALLSVAKRMMDDEPTTIGLGVTSAPLRDVSFDNVLAAAGQAIRKPWLVHDAHETNCSGKDNQGFYERSFKLNATGEVVREYVKVNEERGEFTFTKLGLDGKPGKLERVLAIHQAPLRMEFFERVDGTRTEWKAPRQLAVDFFKVISGLAVKINKAATTMVGFGIVSAPAACQAEELWKAMLFVTRDPATAGQGVDQVQLQHKSGFMVRSMRVISANKVTVDNVRVDEAAKEIISRQVIGGAESAKETVLALRTGPLRVEMHSRNVADKMRIDWKFPSAAAVVYLAMIEKNSFIPSVVK